MENDSGHTITPNRDEDDEDGSVVTFQPQNPYPRAVSENERRRIHNRKKSCGSSCINGNLVALKLLLFIFYGGLGAVATWLNHTQVSKRFSERESLLIYGISSFLSLGVPIIFGLFSDKTAQPKKVLGACLLLAGLLYPLILAVPPSEPYQYRERLKWCNETMEQDKAAGGTGHAILGDAYTSSTACLPNRINCTSTISELIADHGGCSEGCRSKLIVSQCDFKCDESMLGGVSERKGNKSTTEGPSSSPYDEYENANNLVPLAQVSDYDGEAEYEGSSSSEKPPPHVCVNDDPQYKYKNLCFAFDKDMHEITLHASDITGYADHDGKCHYPLTSYPDGNGAGTEPQSLLSCSPVPSHCHVSCDLKWDSDESDQWTCHSDFVQWIISFACFVAIHALGTMLVISAAGLLNSAILSMSHEHSGDFGCQYTYGAFGFAIVPPAAAYLFEYIEAESLEIPWNVEYLVAYCIWLIIPALLVVVLPYHAEWIPRRKTVGPMLRRWTSRGQTILFFIMIAVLGFFQSLNDVLSFHQIKFVGGSLLVIGIGAAAAVAPAFVFICRVERVIDYCGHQNIFAIALVVLSLQFTGYAYLVDTDPKWSFLLKAMETFSVLMVWITASYTTYAAAPRSLAATCQAIIATLYCSVGRGLGGIVGYIGLTFLTKEYFLKILSLLAVFICVLYLFLHYCCLKPYPYTRQFDYDRPATYAPSGRYTPLKLINGKKDKNLAKEDEDLDDKDIGPDDNL